MYDYSDKVVVITGAAGNLGSAVVHAFEAHGASLVLLDRKKGRLQDIFPAISGMDKHLLVDQVDMTSKDSVDDAISKAIAHHGQVDVLVNTVGGYRAGTPVHETPVETMEFLMDLNARTTFLSCQAAVPHMLKAGTGKIINVGARQGMKGLTKASVYAMSKSAVLRLTESLSAELKRGGINVNAVLPGTIDTPANRKAMPDADHSRWVTTQAISEVILFLASDSASAVHGALIPVFGTG
ncbi:MAG: SDR family NAD(P)-dependent oxidoreductase [Anaerolineales bacterium]|nr:MAG: SDR family NAD(P)-dependent oxidoreductase [Anaerolineales bacterium]